MIKMCNFISFFVSVKNNELVCGNPTSHSNAPVHSGMDDYREAEWTEDGLEIRVGEGEDESAYKATVLAKARTREELCKLLGPSTDRAGNKYYFSSKGYHREDGPAVEYASGDKCWYVDGKLHRTDGPAIEGADGYKAWYVDGKRHRTDGPAIERSDGSKYWYVDGKQHRTDGPAVEWAEGYKEWFVDGKLHRTDGPAVERADGSKEWWVDGRFVRSKW